MAALICQILQIYTLIVFARVIMSWFPVNSGAMETITGVLYALTEPVLGPIRRVIPSLGMIDLSPLIVIFGGQILCQIAHQVF